MNLLELQKEWNTSELEAFEYVLSQGRNVVMKSKSSKKKYPNFVKQNLVWFTFYVNKSGGEMGLNNNGLNLLK